MYKAWVSPRGEVIPVPAGKVHKDLYPVKRQLDSGWVRVFDDSMELADRYEDSVGYLRAFCLLKSLNMGSGKAKDVFIAFTSGRSRNIDFSEYECD